MDGWNGPLDPYYKPLSSKTLDTDNKKKPSNLINLIKIIYDQPKKIILYIYCILFMFYTNVNVTPLRTIKIMNSQNRFQSCILHLWISTYIGSWPIFNFLILSFNGEKSLF